MTVCYTCFFERNEREMKEFIENNKELMLETLRELCHIPAPSHFEDERALYCKNWLEKYGAKGVYIDDAKNVIFPINCENSDKITVFVAHTDTVFPDTEPYPYREDDEKIYCPGVSDDTASVVALMLQAKYFIENNIVPENGVMMVLNACEEGLGDLKGTKQIFKDFEGRIAKFISYDSSLKLLTINCVGSHRYEVEVLTEGGHSFGAFGNNNAIAKISEIINKIYQIEVPHIGDSKTTYNVGIISGGTSVNTIAQNVKMLCEYRSDNYECLAIMKKNFEEIFESVRSEKVKVNVKLVGDRPCSNIDFAKVQELIDICKPIIADVLGEEPIDHKASTDCNIPLSQGIPAICIGTRTSKGVHTREECLDKASLIPGLEIAIRVALAMC